MDLLAHPKNNIVKVGDISESIWDFPWAWIAIIVLIITGLAIANHQLNKNRFK
jgi:uncharacterized membrane protein